MEINRCPGFFLDHPFESPPLEQEYLVSELKSMIDFLEKQSGIRWTGTIVTDNLNMDKQIQLSRKSRTCGNQSQLPSPRKGSLKH
jgi:hypothetical protein